MASSPMLGGGGSTASPASRLGVKQALSSLDRRVEAHTDDIAAIRADMGAAGSDVEGMIASLKADLLGAIADVRAELLGKIEDTDAEVQRVNKALTEMKGSHGILQQQTKDSHKRIMEMSEQLHELSLEMNGEEEDV